VANIVADSHIGRIGNIQAKAGSGASKSGYTAIPQAGYIHTLLEIGWKMKMPKYRMHC
jgi:hypothetical protein